MSNTTPVYPARHPEFFALCTNCGKRKHSASLYTGDKPYTYICAKCVSTFGMLSEKEMRDAEIKRDSRENKKYGNFS